MSVQQIEQSVRNLAPEELEKFADWFEAFYAAQEPAAEGGGEVEDIALTAAQRAEIDCRLDALDADPSLAVPWEGTAEIVQRIREKIRAEKTADRRL